MIVEKGPYLESDDESHLDFVIDFNPDDISEIMTEEQLENEKMEVRNFLEESGALRWENLLFIFDNYNYIILPIIIFRVKPNLGRLQIKELVVNYFDGWFKKKDIKVIDVYRCYIQRVSVPLFSSILFNKAKHYFRNQL